MNLSQTKLVTSSKLSTLCIETHLYLYTTLSTRITNKETEDWRV